MTTAFTADLYELLGVEPSAPRSDIVSAYRKLAKELHPDTGNGDATRFADVTQAYEVLSDDTLRAEYDESRLRPVSTSGFVTGSYGDYTDDMGFDMSSVFSRLFTPARPRVHVTILLSFAQSLAGAMIPVRASADLECAACHGYGQQAYAGSTRTCPECLGQGTHTWSTDMMFDVPPGVMTGDQFQLHDATVDLVAIIDVADDVRFSRAGRNVTTTVPVPFHVAALGGSTHVICPDGQSVTIKVPAGSSSHKMLRLSGRGVHAYDGHRAGDLLVELTITVPASLTAQQRELLEQYAATLPSTAHKKASK